MQIPVLDSEMRPLMPTTPAKARMLLKNRKARAYWNKLGVFCIILTRKVEPDNQQLVVGIDPGSKFEGWSVVGTKKTVCNGMSEAPHQIKDAVEQRREMRHARRYRNLRRRPCRSDNPRKPKIPPSTFAKWNAKLRLLKHLLAILPISDVVVEDVMAVTKQHQKRWNINFSPLEVGKEWFYSQIESLDLKLHLKQGWETKELREV